MGSVSVSNVSRSIARSPKYPAAFSVSYLQSCEIDTYYTNDKTLSDGAVWGSVSYEVFEKPAENRLPKTQPVAVGSAYTDCSKTNRLKAG
jgi:hypothetical protein